MRNSIKTIGFSCIRESIKVFLMLLFIFGCSENSDSVSDLKPEALYMTKEAPKQTRGIVRTNKQETEAMPTHDVQKENDALETFKSDNEDRKLIKRADIRIEAEDLESANFYITGLMEKYSAYSVSTVINKGSYRYNIRVPSFAYKAFLAGIDGIGTVQTHSESIEDVTLHYYDTEGRLNTKKELLKTFQSYLGKAKNIDEILSVEKRIAELQSDIDGTGKELRNLSNRVDYATIRLEVLNPAIISLTGRIKELFSDFGNFLSGLTVVFIGIVIFGIPILLLALFFYWILLGKIGILKKLWRMAAGRNA
jgi:hypothetical protein